MEPLPTNIFMYTSFNRCLYPKYCAFFFEKVGSASSWRNLGLRALLSWPMVTSLRWPWDSNKQPSDHIHTHSFLAHRATLHACTRNFVVFACSFYFPAVSAHIHALSCLLVSGNLLVITVATEETDGFNRFMRTARQFNYTMKVSQLRPPLSCPCWWLSLNMSTSQSSPCPWSGSGPGWGMERWRRGPYRRRGPESPLVEEGAWAVQRQGGHGHPICGQVSGCCRGCWICARGGWKLLLEE